MKRYGRIIVILLLNHVLYKISNVSYHSVSKVRQQFGSTLMCKSQSHISVSCVDMFTIT